MPAFSEIGPIEIDPQLSSTIQTILLKNQASFSAFLIEKNNCSKPVQLSLTHESLMILNEEPKPFVSTKFMENSPIVLINYKTNTGFSLLFDENKLDFNSEGPGDRDLIVMTIRMFCSKAQTSSLSQVLLKNQQLSNRLFEANKNYEQSLGIINTLKDEAVVKAGDLLFYQNSFHETEKELINLKENHSKIVNSHENITNEIIFLRKDLLVYKEQCSSLQSKLENQQLECEKQKSLMLNIKEDLESLVKIMNCGTCKVHENLYMVIDRITGKTHEKKNSSNMSSVFSFQDDSVDTEKEKFEDFENYSNQINKIKEEYGDFINKLEAEKNFYKRKAESLAAENDKLLSKLGKNPKDISEFFCEKNSFEETKNMILKELEESKQKIENYERLIKINKKKLENEIERNFEMRKIIQKKGLGSNGDYQRIVNSLTQTLSDREEELFQQKSLNKAFMNRIAELEAMVSLVSKES